MTLTYAFEMQSKEVTQAEFAAFSATNPSYFGPNANGADCGDTCPVERVNWYEALTYANWLSAQKGLKPCFVLSGCGERPEPDAPPIRRVAAEPTPVIPWR